MGTDNLMVFAGSGSRRLAAAICDYVSTPVRENEAVTFSDGNTFVRVLENVR